MESTWEGDIENIVNLLDDCISNPEIFLKTQSDKAEKFKCFTKFFYSAEQKSEDNERINPKGLPTLLLDNFDDEGVWQQLELQNNAAIEYFKGGICNEIVSNVGNISVPNDVEGNIASSSDEDDSEPEGNDYAFDDDDSDAEPHNIQSKISVEDKESNLPRKPKRSEVENTFFNLTEMEEFLNTEDLKEMKNTDGNVSDDSDSIDMFADIPSDMDDDSEDEENSQKPYKDIMYSDFFDPPATKSKTPNENASEDDEVLTKSSKYDTRDFNPDSADDDDEDGGNGNEDLDVLQNGEANENEMHAEDAKDEQVHPKTPFEKQREIEKQRIHDLEEKLMQPKPWHLTGEVIASNRPTDSLLYQQTTFDSNAKPDLVTTDELTARVEDMILNAVLNKAWNDVERKVKPVEGIKTYRKPIELEQTKSKKGLAEVYEDEYLKLHDKTEKDDPKHLEIKKLMDELLPELHALFAHIPKPPVPEIQMVRNLPAISVEDVAPIAISDATLLAPEEVKRKSRGDVKAKTERSITDRKRERRQKKIHQKLRQKKIEEKMAEHAEDSPQLAKKYEKLMAMKTLKKSRNAKFADNKEDKIKSSKDFFSRLQEKVDISNKHKKKSL